MNSERLLLHQTIWRRAESSGAAVASGRICLAPHPALTSPSPCHFPLQLSSRRVRDVWGGEGDERNLGGSWGSVEFEVVLFSLSSPSSMWGREVRRADGEGR